MRAIGFLTVLCLAGAGTATYGCDCLAPGAATYSAQAFAAPAYATGGCASAAYAAPAYAPAYAPQVVLAPRAVYAGAAYSYGAGFQRSFSAGYASAGFQRQVFAPSRVIVQRDVVRVRDVGFGGNNRQFGLLNVNRGAGGGGNNRQFGLFNFSR